MMISTKGRYALRIMLDLAQQEPGVFVSLTDIGKRQNISVKYLEAIVSLLNKAGFLDSMRGKSGGYRLNEKPSEYSVGAVLDAAEGGVNAVTCESCTGGVCNREADCLTLPVWRHLDGLIHHYLSKLTIQDVLDGHVDIDE